MVQPEKPLSASSRRHRRRPSNIKEEFASRHKNHTWLETHVWQAKRMHMGTHWGYRLSDSPCEKSIRAAYKAVRSHCSLHDLSYYHCLQLSSTSIDAIRRVLAAVTVTAAAAATTPTTTTASGIVVSGPVSSSPTSSLFSCGREHMAVLIDPLSNVGASIALVKIVLHPAGRAWLWVHPAAAESALLVLQAAATAAATTTNTPDVSAVSVTSIRDLLRFELRGPGAHAVLHSALKLSQRAESSSSPSTAAAVSSTFAGAEGSVSKAHSVWRALGSVQTPAALGAGTVLALTVSDPRLAAVSPQPKSNPVKPQSSSFIQQRRLAKVIMLSLSLLLLFLLIGHGKLTTSQLPAEILIISS
jgi:ribonuclease P/MRP protein subunit POP1